MSTEENKKIVLRWREERNKGNWSIIDELHAPDYVIVNGKIVEQWSEADMFGLMQQLGVLPTPGHRGSYMLPRNGCGIGATLLSLNE